MKTSLLVAALIVGGATSPAPVAAQSYPIDCAILLCLAGGWPASVPCVRARAEFIRRITPWPVEPPLQIWRCQMHASFQPGPADIPVYRLYEIASGQNAPFQSFPTEADASGILPRLRVSSTPQTEPAVLRQSEVSRSPRKVLLQLAQAAATGGAADIDIIGAEFDFVRSIKVWQVEYRHH